MFQRGHPRFGGRLSGTPNRATQEMRAFARSILENPAYRESIRQRIMQGKAPHLETLLYHYAYGKPRETVGFETADAARVKVVVCRGDGGSNG